MCCCVVDKISHGRGRLSVSAQATASQSPHLLLRGGQGAVREAEKEQEPGLPPTITALRFLGSSGRIRFGCAAVTCCSGSAGKASPAAAHNTGGKLRAALPRFTPPGHGPRPVACCLFPLRFSTFCSNSSLPKARGQRAEMTTPSNHANFGAVARETYHRDGFGLALLAKW